MRRGWSRCSARSPTPRTARRAPRKRSGSPSRRSATRPDGPRGTCTRWVRMSRCSTSARGTRRTADPPPSSGGPWPGPPGRQAPRRRRRPRPPRSGWPSPAEATAWRESARSPSSRAARPSPCSSCSPRGPGRPTRSCSTRCRPPAWWRAGWWNGPGPPTRSEGLEPSSRSERPRRRRPCSRPIRAVRRSSATRAPACSPRPTSRRPFASRRPARSGGVGRSR